jgi:hypothetical protein
MAVYEGMIASWKLLAPNDPTPTFVLVNDMYGDYKVTKKDNFFFSRINIE